MLSFKNDYLCGAHPAVLAALEKTNLEPLTSFCMDRYCEEAREKIRRACGLPDAPVYFMMGGTQVNQVVLDGILERCEGVIAPVTGHIATHEGGAIEKTGHKVIELPGKEGKLSPETLRHYLELFAQDENKALMVYPGAVNLSYPTEYGTLYTKAELTEIYGICKEYGLRLFIDGARLGYGLASRTCDMDLPTLASLCDVFYIGGTKLGALLGEAVVFSNIRPPRYFETFIKQHGAMLAKGRVYGVQFDALFTDELYFKIARHAIDMAEELKAIFREKGLRYYLETPTNQQFLLMEDEKARALQEKVDVYAWEKPDPTHTIIRFVTSWSTSPEDVAALREIL